MRARPSSRSDLTPASYDVLVSGPATDLALNAPAAWMLLARKPVATRPYRLVVLSSA